MRKVLIKRNGMAAKENMNYPDLTGPRLLRCLGLCGRKPCKRSEKDKACQKRVAQEKKGDKKSANPSEKIGGFDEGP